MKALRIVLTQNKAHYKKEETVENKMTYPLPPFSTVIGSLHSACGFKEYKPMDLSIQGEYKSLVKQAYTDHCFLDSAMDDRGILVKMKNSLLYSNSFDKVATAKKSQGNSFKKGITIEVHNEELLTEYRSLKDKMATAKDKDEKNIINKYLSKFKSLTTSLKYYEILTEVELIIHVKAEFDTLNQIKENIYSLKSIGRSEDFVDVNDCDFIELQDNINKTINSKYSAYINYDLIQNDSILLHEKSGVPASGTKYWLNKVYNTDNGYREFSKAKVVYSSNFLVHNKSKGVFYDEKGYIVNFN